MPVKGADLVSKNIIKFGGGFFKHVNDTMKEVGALLDTQVTENLSLSDHSLKDLAALGHPYAARYGTSKAESLHSPYFQVHRQSGRLLAAKFSGTKEAQISLGVLQASAFVGLNESVAEHAVFVVYGTSKMIPRPILQGSRDQIIGQAQTVIRTRLRNLVTNFKGDKPQ